MEFDYIPDGVDYREGKEPIIAFADDLELHIFYHSGNTYVETLSSYNGDDPTFTVGIISVEDLIADYALENELQGGK